RRLGAALLLFRHQPRLALFEQRPPRLLGLALRGDVARHFREAAQLPVPVVNGGDQDIRKEAGAILAQAPTLVLVSPIANGLLQLHLRLVGILVHLRIEDREVLSDDFLWLVALD